MVLSEGTHNSLCMFLCWRKPTLLSKCPQVLVYHGSESRVSTGTCFVVTDCDPSSQQRTENDVYNSVWEGLRYIEPDP